MRLFRSVVPLSLAAVFAKAIAKDVFSREKHYYQSDVSRLRKIVIDSLYSHSDIFIRELISNANDALEKFRLSALTNPDIWNDDPLNITIKIEKDEGGKGGRIIISDSGIGMTPEELTINLGTLAKSGTSDFLSRAENSEGSSASNLIGAFGLGFYSSFLVADRVEVASIPFKNKQYPDPIQHIFSSTADDNSFEVYPDPRGNTLGRGTEITLYLKPGSQEYLENSKIIQLVNKHSSYSSSFPLYIFDRRMEDVPTDTSTGQSAFDIGTDTTDTAEDEAFIQEVPNNIEAENAATKKILVEEWVQLNVQPPIWARDPKNLTEDDYRVFYSAFFKDFSQPISWQHFSGDSGSGVSFKALLYLPGKLSDQFQQQPMGHRDNDIKLMVKRVFITSELGKNALPQWASWVKAVVDADDLPLNVSRETLQSNGFLRQLRRIILKRLLQMFNKLADDLPKFKEVTDIYGSIFKMGSVEDAKHREKLAALCRFTTNQRKETSLDQYLENKKKGQKQIFYLAEIGKQPEDLAKSVFVEQLHARGYEVLLLNEPVDELFVSHLRQWKNIPFQDAAKAGLKFGDEDLHEDDKEKLEVDTEKFRTLLDWLKNEAKDTVRDVVISKRLVKSPCAIVADEMGYTANLQRLIASSNAGTSKSPMFDYAMKAKVMEINPRSPLMEGLLRHIEELPSEVDDDNKNLQQLKEFTKILIDGALVRSGFAVSDSNSFFTRIDRVLRRSLGVLETAATEETIRPAPPVDPSLDQTTDDEDDGHPKVIIPDDMKDKLSIEMEEIDEDGNPVVRHDEL